MAEKNYYSNNINNDEIKKYSPSGAYQNPDKRKNIQKITFNKNPADYYNK